MRWVVIAYALLIAACQGERGPAGEDGEDGKDGVDGETGAQGADGAQGLQGLPGPMGPPGERGERGAQGAKGDQGDTGDRGAAGPAGSAGSQAAAASGAGGASYRPASFVGCGVLLDLLDGAQLGEDGEADTVVQYAITIFSNDDVEVRCNAVLGAKESPQFSAFYPSITMGAQTATCDVTADYPPYPSGGGRPGYWRMQLNEGVPTATYVDDDLNHPLDGSGYTFVDADCGSFVMDLGGKWYAATLADAL